MSLTATNFMLKRVTDVSVLARKVLLLLDEQIWNFSVKSEFCLYAKILSTLKPFSHYVYNKIQTREKDYKPKKVEREPYTGPVIKL